MKRSVKEDHWIVENVLLDAMDAAHQRLKGMPSSEMDGMYERWVVLHLMPVTEPIRRAILRDVRPYKGTDEMWEAGAWKGKPVTTGGKLKRISDAVEDDKLNSWSREIYLIGEKFDPHRTIVNHDEKSWRKDKLDGEYGRVVELIQFAHVRLHHIRWNPKVFLLWLDFYLGVRLGMEPSYLQQGGSYGGYGSSSSGRDVDLQARPSRGQTRGGRSGGGMGGGMGGGYGGNEGGRGGVYGGNEGGRGGGYGGNDQEGDYREYERGSRIRGQYDRSGFQQQYGR